MADPTPSQSKQWAAFKARVQKRTMPRATALVIARGVARDAESMAERLTGRQVLIVTPDDDQAISEIARRATLLDKYIAKAELKDYGVQFRNGDLNIVAFEDNEATRADVYPLDSLAGFGLAPIVIVAGIAALTLLIAGDQAADRLEKEAEIEATRLQKRALDLDAQMMRQPAEVRDQWDRWKKQSHDRAIEKAKQAGANVPLLDKLIGKGGKTSLIGGLLLLAAVAMGLREFRKG